MKTKPEKAPAHFDSLEQEAFLNLWRTYDRLRTLEDALFVPFDLTPQQYNVLRLLRAAHPEAVQTLALADKLVSCAPDITRMLDKLEQRSLIARQRPADNRRVVLVTITKAGLNLLEEIDDPLRACHKKQLGHLEREELKEMIMLLQRVRGPHEDRTGPWG